jgi:hypothetical protein
MTKKNPAYESGWHTTGTLKVLPSIEQVVQRLEENPDVVLHAGQFRQVDGWWACDAVWMAGDVRVRGRLSINNRSNPNDSADSAQGTFDPNAYDPASTPLNGYFHVFAEADRPWEAHWPSPLQVFLDRKLKPSYVTLEYSSHNPLHPKSTTNLSGLLGTLAELPWLATVLVHDEIALSSVMSSSGVSYEMPLISRLPPSLYGRILDVRILGEAARKKTNVILKKYGTHLPQGGAAILLPTGRRKGISQADLSFPMAGKSFAEGGDITPLAASLSNLLAEQVMNTDTDAIDELRKEWTLLTDAEKEQEETLSLASAAERIKELEEENGRLLEHLSISQEFNDQFRNSADSLLEELQKSVLRECDAINERDEALEELSNLKDFISESDLGKATQERDEALEEAELSEELLDEQTHELTALRQEVASLRRELGRLGSTFVPAPPATVEDEAPSTWDDFFTCANSLEFVKLGKVESEVDKLRGQVQERIWINRSWEALMALEEYARLKKERGAEELPHFHAYLLDPKAEHVIPRTRYSGTESKGVMMNSRFVAARTLPVPTQVDPSGKIVMEAHIRIGSGKPPAPRMHFHDDTSGSTGKIYVGHLGPHLPNYQTN